MDESDDENAQANPKSFVFDRLQLHSVEKHPSVFTPIGESKDPKVSVFNKIKDGSRPKRSVFTRSKTIEKPSDSCLQQEKSSAFRHLGVINEVKSSIPSRIKQLSTLDVKMDGSLRVKRRIVVLTGQQKS